VETVSGLRVIPNLDVIRPADPEETAGTSSHHFHLRPDSSISGDERTDRQDPTLEAYLCVSCQCDVLV
jgi:hypothetical protein